MEHFLSSDLNRSMAMSQGCGDSQFCSSENRDLRSAYAICSVMSEGYLGKATRAGQKWNLLPMQTYNPTEWDHKVGRS